MTSRALAVSYDTSDGQHVEIDRDYVQRYVLTGNGTATDAEVAGFLAKCQARGMNPLAGDAYLVKYGDKPAATITSKDYFMRTASKAETFKGLKAGIVVMGPDGRAAYREGTIALPGEVLLGGWAEAYDSRRDVPFRDEVAVEEYDTGKSLWATKKATMIRKVAVVHVLREAYPDRLGGLYDTSEMGGPVEVEPTVEARPDARPERTRGAQEARLTGEQAQALAVLAEWLAGRTGEDPMEAKAGIVRACGDPRGQDFADYYMRAKAWAESTAAGAQAEEPAYEA